MIHVHPQALCESESVGAGTRIWAFAHVMRGAIVGEDCNIGEGVFIESGATVGDRVTIKNQSLIWDGIHLADDVFVGPAVVFTNDLRPRSPRMPDAKRRYERLETWRRETWVGQGASLGARAVILPDLTIGCYAMVAAGAIVSRDVRPHELVKGTPARHAGWVCVCGDRIPESRRCSSCGTAYQFDGTSVTLKV